MHTKAIIKSDLVENFENRINMHSTVRTAVRKNVGADNRASRCDEESDVRGTRLSVGKGLDEPRLLLLVRIDQLLALVRPERLLDPIHLPSLKNEQIT